MMNSIYTSLTGLQSFSKGLDIISNNVANMNTLGFKSSQSLFQDLFYQYNSNGNGGSNSSQSQIGHGVTNGATTLNFKQGDLRATQNPLDAAIDGNGFFVLRDNGKSYFSRAGQFSINADGFLVDNANNMRVAALNGTNGVRDINVNGFSSSPPKATSAVTFTGNLSSGQSTFTINSLPVFDASGAQSVLKLTFTNKALATPAGPAGTWTVEVRDATGALLGSGDIVYEAGLPKTGANTLAFTLNTNGVAHSTITLNFGDPGTTTGSTSFSGGSTASDLKVGTTDGYGVGALLKASIDNEGYLVTVYSNGQKTKHDRLALALFDNVQALKEQGKGIFTSDLAAPLIAPPGDKGLGKIVPGNVELSNVQLTEQFTDMIIIQRGYQGCSQIISVSNEMIQQLYDMRTRK